MSHSKPRRQPRFGPEVWESRGGHDWSLWDLWFCIVARHQGDHDLEGLADAQRAVIRGLSVHGTEAAEARLSHVLDLSTRLSAARLEPADLADSVALGDKQLVRRAHDKVSGRISLEWRARTAAMIDTPRRRFERRARFGHWPTFPMNPQGFFDRLSTVASGRRHVSAANSFHVVPELEACLDDLDPPDLSVSDRLALYRGFHTAGLELADNTNDSYGELGRLRAEAWQIYLSLDWRATPITADDYWQDLCELLVWEKYAIDFRREETWFRSATEADIAIIEPILLDLEAEFRHAILDYYADEALEGLASLFLATNSYHRFDDAARLLGSRSWMPIDKMGRARLAQDGPAGASEVFRAADQPGDHRDHLRRLCLELTGVDLASH